MRQITQCFNATLASIREEVATLQTLTTRVQQHLSEAIPCSVSRFSQGCLVLSVDDAVWANKLRYELPALRDALRRAGLHQLTAIRIHLSLCNDKTRLNTPTKNAALSLKAQKTLHESAKQCSYPPLKAALERLAKNV